MTFRPCNLQALRPLDPVTFRPCDLCLGLHLACIRSDIECLVRGVLWLQVVAVLSEAGLGGPRGVWAAAPAGRPWAAASGLAGLSLPRRALQRLPWAHPHPLGMEPDSGHLWFGTGARQRGGLLGALRGLGSPHGSMLGCSFRRHLGKLWPHCVGSHHHRHRGRCHFLKLWPTPRGQEGSFLICL